MTTLTFPSVQGAGAAEFGLAYNTRVFVSPFNGFTQTVELPGAHWFCRATFTLDAADHRLMQAFLAKLRGAAGRFYYGDPYYLLTGPSGAGGGTPLVKGAGQTGTSLIVDGWPNGVNVLDAGDYIHFDNADGGRALHQVVADATANGSGETTLSIEPPIRVAPADNAAITVSGAKGIFRLIDDRQGILPRHRLGRGPLTLEMIECFSDAA